MPKIVSGIVVVLLVTYLLFFGGSLVQSIFEIGRQVGKALAYWI
ncbi:hypothetical protein [Marinilactibacillus psychrotolerans]|uniref:Uncharacterized protein n=1 Tax=Marinilactibacillus psychrotolerans 42ea TaxID=1255609 RepID=A0A1R4IZT3_9LACT|nr:hypothetical protein [Marinilactibacillus psychrotolerans]SJN25401.1 hypothetical protein FM115_03345 [Marinilactibacillus psychrotolerans 42ea]